jgi:hypothetical protein
VEEKMNDISTKLKFLPAAVILLAGITVPINAQVTCAIQSISEQQLRAEGNTELLGDLVLACTGGTPTAAGQMVPQVNFTVVLNTNLTSKITYPSPSGNTANFSEALMLVDEPNQAVPPSSNGGVSNHSLLNCGQVGAPDNGVSGPGVCDIISTGIPTQTYDGTPSAGPAGICFPTPVIATIASNVYGCGRPNAFQGQMHGSSVNELDFLGVPFDPPGVGGVRYLRITNLRADAALLNNASPINCTVAISGTSAITFPGGSNSISVTLGFTQTGLTASAPALGTLRVTEAFPSSFKDRNIAFTVDNAMYSAGKFSYVPPDQNYPAQLAQNVPGIFYTGEDGFQWQNNTTNPPPSPNPPVGFATGVFTTNTNYPLNSVGYGGVKTGISADGVSSAGTRIALTFKTLAPSVSVPSVVYLHHVGSPSTTSGVMVLTKTDPAGAGPFTTGASTTLHSGDTAVYEVLYADPFAVEYADIDISVNSFIFGAKVTVSLAPFYSVPGAAFATPTASHPTPTAIPRFSPAGSPTVVVSSSIFGIFLPFF